MKHFLQLIFMLFAHLNGGNGIFQGKCLTKIKDLKIPIDKEDCKPSKRREDNGLYL